MDNPKFAHTAPDHMGPEHAGPDHSGPDVGRHRSVRGRLSVLALGAASLALSVAGVGGTASAAPHPAMTSMMVSVKVATVAKYGKILEDQSGLPLYYDTANKGTHWACTGACLVAWPPLVLPKGQAKVEMGKGVTKIGLVKGPSGEQVTWHGKALYTFIKDKTGKVTGQGLGKVWYVAQLSGAGAPPGGGVAY
jgi:predicted lipoprotein with Yx(FWY)xxD motif